MGAFIFRIFLVIISTSFIHQVSGKSNYTDDETPYEFGFVIEGEQHRHEKKDVKGIIEGEFGFITADGVYHVTVYATDENGNFRIISMKNTRVSGPLDGDYKKKSVPGVSSPGQRQGKSERLTLPNKPSVESSTGGPFVKYSTKPTLKPGCGGCGYVTTKKPKPGQKFPVLQPLDKPKPSKYTSAGTPGRTPTNDQEYPSTYSKPGTGTSRNVDDAGIDPRYDEEQPGSVSNKPGVSVNRPGVSANRPGVPVNRPDVPSNRPGVPENRPGVPVNRPGVPVNNQLGQTEPVSPNRPYKVNERIAKFQKEVSNDIQDLEGKVQNLRNPQLSADYKAGKSPPLPDGYESPVKVNNGIIKVPGSPDIRIQDKYPGMQEGLPPGMKESDITDLLYKFNYTLGFHGHYEKGYKNGAKIGGYFVNGRDGISRIVTYVADENGFRPRVKFVRLGLEDEGTPKEGTEKNFGLVNFEFVWYPVE